MSSSELVVHVDENDEVLGGIPRKDAHSKKRLLHREVDIFLVNKYGLLLIERVRPKKWCHVGGHPDYFADSDTSEDWLDSAIREFKEEVGYELKPSDLEEVAHYIRRTETSFRINHRFGRVFLAREDIPIEEFRRQEAEVVGLRYFRRPELEAIIQDQNKIMGGTPFILTEVAPQIMDRVPYS